MTNRQLLLTWEADPIVLLFLAASIAGVAIAPLPAFAAIPASGISGAGELPPAAASRPVPPVPAAGALTTPAAPALPTAPAADDTTGAPTPASGGANGALDSGMVPGVSQPQTISARALTPATALMSRPFCMRNLITHPAAG